MATSQQFDALDGLVITGKLDVGGNVAIDIDTLFVDSSNDRVGINRIPGVGTALDINGVINATSGVFSSLTVDGLINHNGDSGTYLEFTNDTLRFLGNSTERFKANTTGVYANGGLQVESVSISPSSYQSAAPSQAAAGAVGAAWVYTTFIESDSERGSASTGIAISEHTTSASYGNIPTDTISIITGGARQLTANNTHVDIHENVLNNVNDMNISGQIISSGDTNTYLQFNAADTFRVVTGGAQRFLANNTGAFITGSVDVSLDITTRRIRVEDYFIETKVAAQSGTGTKTFDLNTGSSFEYTGTGAGFTAAFSNYNTTYTTSWSLKTTNSGPITWPAAVNWAESEVPPDSAGTDIYSFICIAGTIYGSLAIRNAG